MKSIYRYLATGAALLFLSSSVYLIQVWIFNNTRDTVFYLLQDLAFIPVQILVVTVIVNELIARNEKRSMLKKMNMVIGAFFSEVGTELLRTFARFDSNSGEMRETLRIGEPWNDKTFQNAVRAVAGHNYSIGCTSEELLQLKSFLQSKRTFMLSLLENQNLLEHTSFTDLLWAVFHLTEELEYRKEIGRISSLDCSHIEGDVKRAYSALVSEWLLYVQHLKSDYPYIFSLVSRMNPFDLGAAAEIKEK